MSNLGREPRVFLRIIPPEYGFSISGLSVVSDRVFEPGFRERLSQELSRHDLHPRVQHSVYAVFSDADFEAAPLLEVTFSEIWIDEVDFSRKCQSCSTQVVSVDYARLVDRVAASGPALDVNGQFLILSRAAVDAVHRNGFIGAEFPPFDKASKYFYVQPALDLASPIIKSEEVLGHSGACVLCGSPLYRAFFGPLRFRASQWKGQDFAYTSGFSQLLFSKRAFDLLHALDPMVERDRPVFLE